MGPCSRGTRKFAERISGLGEAQEKQSSAKDIHAGYLPGERLIAPPPHLLVVRSELDEVRLVGFRRDVAEPIGHDEIYRRSPVAPRLPARQNAPLRVDRGLPRRHTRQVRKESAPRTFVAAPPSSRSRAS